MGDFGIRYSLKDKNEAKTDKTEHEKGKSRQNSMAQIASLGEKDESMAIMKTSTSLTQEKHLSQKKHKKKT
ncbi:hypothetical protein Tco_1477373 [Tanacetum coccineum]